jgi:nucleotide-binding universal stress UspA family protein
MFEQILFATSATPACDPAARVAFNLAQRHGGRLALLHVLGVPTRGFSQEVLDVRTGEKVQADADYIAWVREEIRQYYAKQLEAIPDAAIDIRLGYPHREILRKARDENPDLIVMGGTTEDPDSSVYKKVMVGSTFHRVAKAAFCPVLAVGRSAASFWGGTFSHIVFATDFSKAANAGFAYALQLARSLDAELHLFHALDIGTPQTGVLVDQDTIEKRLREARQRIRGLYVAQMGDFKNFAIEVWEGIPYIEIVKFARERQADLIIMAHHGQPQEVETARLSSTMEQVIVRANCPVLSVNRPIKAQ